MKLKERRNNEDGDKEVDVGVFVMQDDAVSREERFKKRREEEKNKKKEEEEEEKRKGGDKNEQIFLDFIYSMIQFI